MITRNFKIRIHNLNLKKVVFLESSTDQHAVRAKYTKYLASLGYDYIRTYSTSRNIKSYHFYPTALFKTRRAYHRQHPNSIFRRTPPVDVNVKPQLLNPYMVLLEIIEMSHKHKPSIL
jgi:hypothetical protein